MPTRAPGSVTSTDFQFPAVLASAMTPPESRPRLTIGQAVPREETTMNESIRTPARLGVAGFLTTAAAAVAILFAPGCGGDDPCQEYVDYLCDCGASNCDEVKNTYEGADAKLQDECENTLQDLQAADDDAGEDCAAVGGSDTGA